MSQIKHITSVLKQCLKEQQLTYSDVATSLNISEASIKRCFANARFSLERLEEICSLMNMELTDLFRQAQKQNQHLSQLTEEQEIELLQDPKLLLAAVCVRDGWQLKEITEHYDIDEFEGIRLFAKLDKLNLIELLPGNSYRLLIAQDFRWIPGGPLEQYMEREVMVKFMAPQKNEPWTFRFYLRGRYSSSSITIIQRRLNQVLKEAAQLNEEDHVLPIAERQHIGLLMAMRPWEPSLFEKMRRLK